MNLDTIIKDIDIVIQAIINKDWQDATIMLQDIQEDLKILNELND